VVAYSTPPEPSVLLRNADAGPKVLLLPWIMHRLIRALNVRWDVETADQHGRIDAHRHRAGDLRVLICHTITQLAGTNHQEHARYSHRLQSACVPDDDHSTQGGLAGDRLSWRWKTACSSRRLPLTYGMPMVVELGIALDVLVGTLIFGVFFFHIRETFESLDIHHLEKLKER